MAIVEAVVGWPDVEELDNGTFKRRLRRRPVPVRRPAFTAAFIACTQ